MSETMTIRGADGTAGGLGHHAWCEGHERHDDACQHTPYARPECLIGTIGAATCMQHDTRHSACHHRRGHKGAAAPAEGRCKAERTHRFNLHAIANQPASRIATVRVHHPGASVRAVCDWACASCERRPSISRTNSSIDALFDWVRNRPPCRSMSWRISLVVASPSLDCGPEYRPSTLMPAWEVRSSA